jgi:carbon monoxide dehydrogenase subunit G
LSSNGGHSTFQNQINPGVTMIKTIAIVIVLAILAILAYAATRPNDMRVERKISIKAAPEKIFPYINDFHQWAVWSPYEKIDPSMQRTHSGPQSGVGAVYGWSGTGKAGVGRMEITSTTPASQINIKLDFEKPFAGHFTTLYTFVPQGDNTEVTWAMFGPAAYISKVMGIFFNMDNMIGRDFETGLANLKTVAEK